VNFFIAREGEEIGEWSRDELERYAREGLLVPTDYYWRHGMESWQPLSDLLPAATWDPSSKTAAPAPAPAAEPPAKERKPASTTDAAATPKPAAAAAPHPAVTQKLQVDEPVAEEEPSDAPPPPRPPELNVSQLFANPAVRYAIGGVALLLGITLVYTLWPERANTNPPLRLDQAAEEPSDPASERAGRDKAAADLRQRLEALPSRAAPPQNTFYFDLRVKMSRSPAQRARWRAVITGSEHVVDPAQDKVVTQTLFTLTTDYRDGAWTFFRYDAQITNLETLETITVEHDETTEAPPSLATILGLRILPR
jgi:hypothetical protein